MKWWYAAFSAVSWVLPPPATAADDLPGAARELARKTAVFAGRGESVAISWRNVSSLSGSDVAAARTAFESALRQAGARAAENAPIEARITLSESPSQYLMVEEIRRGDDKQVWIAAWKQTEPIPRTAFGLTLEKRLLWEQDEPILDVALAPDLMLILSPGRLTWVRKEGTVSFDTPKTPSRDHRGRLRPNGAGFEARLPGVSCKVASAPQPPDCRTADDAWVLESGSRSLLAYFTAGRNYFDGRVAIPAGTRKTFTPFYSAAAFEENGRALWVLAMLDGRAQIFDAAFDPVGAIAGWGSDIAGTSVRCGSVTPVLTTRPGDTSEPDAIQAFSIVNGAAVPMGAPLDLRGPVTALWPSGGNGAVAVVRDLQSGKYAAYLIAIACGA